MPSTLIQPRIIKMKDSLDTNQNFHIALAHLFYAIAMADRTISREEKLHIIAFVKKYWSKNVAGADSEALIYETLRKFIAGNMEAQKAFLAFSENYYRNKKHFEAPLKAQIAEACDAIATKKGKRSKMELILLTKLHSLFYPKKN